MLTPITNKTKIILLFVLMLGLLLRSYKIDTYPSLNPDEAALGYNAYSLIQTGKDEHGIAWPLHFKSFGDYKPGGYVYLSLPFIKIFGLTPFAVRLPNLIFSVITIFFLFKLIHLLTSNEQISLLASFVLAINPWHIHFSRGAWESSVALSLILIGIYYFYSYIIQRRQKSLFIFTLLFGLSLYFYHSARIVAPAFALSLLLAYRQTLFANVKLLFFVGLFGIIIATPVTISFLKSGGAARFGGVGITADQGPIWRANELLNQHGNTKLVNRAIHNKRLLYLISWAEKYTSHFDLNFLFLNGDEVPRSKSPDMGQFYLLELPTLILGIIFLIKYPHLKKLVLILILFSPLASSLTFQAPSALRALPLAVPLTILVSLGIHQLIIIITSVFSSQPQTKYFFYTLFFLAYAFSINYFYDAYFNHSQKRYPFAWNYGFDRIVPLINLNASNFNQIYVTDKYDQPYILYLFFSKYPPAKIQSQIKLTPPDNYGFSTVRQIDKIHFEKINWDEIPPKTLAIAADEKISDIPVKLINFPNDQAGFKIYIK